MIGYVVLGALLLVGAFAFVDSGGLTLARRSEQGPAVLALGGFMTVGILTGTVLIAVGRRDSKRGVSSTVVGIIGGVLAAVVAIVTVFLVALLHVWQACNCSRLLK